MHGSAPRILRQQLGKMVKLNVENCNIHTYKVYCNIVNITFLSESMCENFSNLGRKNSHKYMYFVTGCFP